MLEITNKPEPDPVASLHILDAYMRWALLAAEEIVGAPNMHIILRRARLERLVDNYPPNRLEVSGDFTFGDYANFCAALLDFFGRAGEEMVGHIGGTSARKAISQQFELYNISGLIGSQTLPVADQLQLGMEAILAGFQQLAAGAGEEWRGHIEDRGVTLAFVVETCPLCAGKRANGCIGALFTGMLRESAKWLLNQQFAVKETACRAKGDPAGVWEVNKTPLEKS